MFAGVSRRTKEFIRNEKPKRPTILKYIMIAVKIATAASTSLGVICFMLIGKLSPY